MAAPQEKSPRHGEFVVLRGHTRVLLSAATFQVYSQSEYHPSGFTIDASLFFRHFDDMETLFKAADDQLRDSYEALFIGGDRQGSLSDRVHRAVERRSAAFEQLKNLMLGTKALLWRYETLRKNYARNQKGLRKDLEAWLPELNGLPEVECESVHAIASKRARFV